MNHSETDDNRLKIRLLETQNAELLKLRTTEREYIKLRANFLDVISFEVRSPLTSILTETELLLTRRRSDDEKADDVQALTKIRQCANHINQIIDDMLDNNRMEMGELILENKPFSINRILEDMNMLFRNSIESKGIRFEVSRLSNDVFAYGDAARIKQILRNLLSNARKFTDTGQVSLDCQITQSDIGTPTTTATVTTTVTFTVRDTGIGMPQEQLDALRQQLLRPTLAKGYGFTGLGLKVCMQLVALMHSTMTMNSKIATATDSPKTGTTVNDDAPQQSISVSGTEIQVKIPLTNASTIIAISPPTYLVQTITNFPDCSILIADDDETNLICMQKILSLLGYRNIVAVDDGLAAQRECARNQFDMILLDDYMPMVTGTELCRQIRAKHPQQIIIIVSANVVHAKDYFNYFGANDFIAKPFTVSQMRQTLFKWEEKLPKKVLISGPHR